MIGTGASAIQFVPEVAKQAEALTIYQRSAPWILPKPDREYPEWEQRLFRRLPARVAAARLGMFGFIEGATYAFTGTRWMMVPFRAIADRERRSMLHDPDLRRKATPDYEIGCKRILFTSDWYPTLLRENVELLTGGVERITERRRRRRRCRARGRRDHLRDRLSVARLRRPDGDPRARRDESSTRSGARRPTPTSAPPSPASPTCS